MTDKDLCEDCAFKNKCEKYKKCLSLQEKLEIAIKALEVYADSRTWDCCYRNQCAYVDGFEADEALRKIKELFDVAED